MTESYLEALAESLGCGLGDDEIDAVLDLARVVAHGSERRFAPVSAYLVGRYVAARTAPGTGVSRAEALAEAAAAAARALPEPG